MTRDELKRLRDHEVRRLKSIGADGQEAWAIVNAGAIGILIREDIAQSIRRLNERAKRKKQWSNKRIAGWIEGRLIKAGIMVTRKGTDSIYLDCYYKGEFACTIRVADHPQPAGGGFKGHDDFMGTVRYGEADILVDPDHTDWKIAVKKVLDKCF